MKLPVGARLPHDFAEIPADEPEVIQRNRALYRVTEVLIETPWSCLYRGKKVFRNFEFSKGTLSEATDDECLDVLIRTLSYPRTDDRDYIKARREHLWFEAKKVLGCRRTNSIAEPLDYLEVRNDQDQFAFPRPGKIPAAEPILILETIQGMNLARWRQSAAADVSAVIRVLGQTLQFFSTMHEESFLVNVVSPAGFWVDPLPRVHFLGTETVVDEKHATAWRGLFPAERYAQGFVARELLQPTHAPTRRSDLFGWGALAWYLLTGDSPAKLAADQQQRWTRFGASHRERLKRDLFRWSSAQVKEFTRELGVSGNRFETHWPDSFLDGLWSCLEADPALRPGSVSDLRAWWENPPPSPVPACLNVIQRDRTARILFSTSGLPTGIEFQISRQFGNGPQSRVEGEKVWSGSGSQNIQTRLPPDPGMTLDADSRREWYFSVFAMETHGTTTTVSRPTIAINVDATVSGYRRLLAESLGSSAGSLPEEILLLCDLSPIEVVAGELLESHSPTVRCWAIALLERGLGIEAISQSVLKQIESRALTDEDYEVRISAAGALLRATPFVDATSVANLAQRLSEGEIDNMIRAVRGFAAFGITASVIEAAIELLEQQHRFIACPECQQELRARDLDAHLKAEHKYVPFEGKLLPFGQALTRLWSRVLTQSDTASLSALAGHLQQRHGERAVSAFASALSQQVVLSIQLRQDRLTDNQQRKWIEVLAQCLRTNDVARSACRTLLGHDDSRIRLLARETTLAEAVRRLADDQTTAAMFRRVIDQLVPLPIVGERIETCHRLLESGADPLAGAACERELELDRLTDCPECGSTFPIRELGRHRRGEHHVYEWEGFNYSREALISLLLNRTVSAEPDTFAARNLEDLFVDPSGGGGWHQLYISLRSQLLDSLQHENASNLAAGVGQTLGALELAASMSRLFLREDHWACQMTGLAILGNLDGDPPADLLREAVPLLGNPRIPDAVCRQLVVHLLRWISTDSEICQRALRAFASRAADKLNGVEQLRALEQWVGPSPMIEAACDELLSQVRMRCPRCSVSLPPPELSVHLLSEHGLILEGRNVRKPWSVAIDLLDAYAEDPQAEYLERADQMAELASPQFGRVRLSREALRRGIAPAHYRGVLVDSVKTTTDTLCPNCWETIPTGSAPLDLVKIDDGGNVSSPAVSIRRVGIPGLWSSVEIAPWEGVSPPWTFTRWGAMGTIGLPFFGAAIVCLLLAWQGYTATQAFVVYSFLAGVLGMVGVAIFYWNRTIEPVDVAWQMVAPALLEDKEQPFGWAHSEFLASLARSTAGHGSFLRRDANLVRAIDAVRPLVRRGILPAQHLAELCYLRLVDGLPLLTAASGPAIPARPRQHEDVLTELLTLALEGELPLDAVTHQGAALTRFSSDELMIAVWHLVLESRRLGLSAADLAELFRKSATLKVLAARLSLRPKSLFQFFAILAMESSGRLPVEFCSAKKQVNAKNFHSVMHDVHVLARSDLKLSGRSDADAILLRAGSIEFRGCRYTSIPNVTVEPSFSGAASGEGGTSKCVLKIDGNRWEFKTDQTLLAARIIRGAKFVFGELQILIDRLELGSSSPRFANLLSGPREHCPRCHTTIELKPGSISTRV